MSDAELTNFLRIRLAVRRWIEAGQFCLVAVFAPSFLLLLLLFVCVLWFSFRLSHRQLCEARESVAPSRRSVVVVGNATACGRANCSIGDITH